MLEKERFLAIKKLARDIRDDNKVFFDNLKNETVEVAVKEKDDFVDRIISNMASAFSSGEQGREEKQIFRANILIPDDEEFYNNYSKDKNIRNLMNLYSVNIEDIMSKITELNIYGKYIGDMEKEEDKFVDEMVNLTPKEAEDLLDEIDNLSNTLTNLDIKEDKIQNEKPVAPKPEPKVEAPVVHEEENKFITPNIQQPAKKEPKAKPAEEKKQPKKIAENDELLGDSFENIEGALSGFVVDFNNLKKEIKEKKADIEKLESEIQKQINENSKLSDKNTSLKEEIANLKSERTDLKSERADLKTEISELNKRIKVLEDKLYKSATLLKKVYNGIKN